MEKVLLRMIILEELEYFGYDSQQLHRVMISLTGNILTTLNIFLLNQFYLGYVFWCVYL